MAHESLDPTDLNAFNYLQIGAGNMDISWYLTAGGIERALMLSGISLQDPSLQLAAQLKSLALQTQNLPAGGNVPVNSATFPAQLKTSKTTAIAGSITIQMLYSHKQGNRIMVMSQVAQFQAALTSRGIKPEYITCGVFQKAPHYSAVDMTALQKEYLGGGGGGGFKWYYAAIPIAIVVIAAIALLLLR